MKHTLTALAFIATPASAQVFETPTGPVRVEPMVEGLDRPWSFAFLPDFATTGAMPITERPGALKFRLLPRLDMEAGGIGAEERLFADAYGRIRDVREGPGGAIWFVTDEDPGAIWRMCPAG